MLRVKSRSYVDSRSTVANILEIKEFMELIVIDFDRRQITKCT